MSCVSALTASATSITINIDDVSRVSVKVNYVEQEGLVNGDNKLDIADNAPVTIEAKDGAFISKVVRKSTSAEEYVSNMKQCYLSVSAANDGETWSVTSINADEARDGKCRIYVDDASKVKVQRSGTYTYAELSDGWNDVSFITATELPLTIGPADYSTPLYSVKVNGKAIEAQGSAYRVTPANGDEIEILANYPDEDVPVTFSYANEESKGFITSVKVGDTEVSGYNDAGFSVKLGQKLTIAGDGNSYKLNQMTVNGSPVSFYGSYSFVVTGETKIYVDARKYGVINAVIDIDHPENVKVYEGYSYNNKLITLKEGRNEISLVETNAMVQILPESGCNIKSVSDGTTSYAADYSKAYTVTLTEGMVLTVKTEAISRDKHAVVYIDDKSAATYYFNFQRGDRSSIEMSTGYNDVAFYNGDNPFGVSWYGAPFASIYKNGESVKPMYEGTATYELNLADGDVVKIYLASNPEKQSVSFKLSGIDAANVSVTCDRLTNMENWAAGFDVLPGTEVALASKDGSQLSVKVNGEPLAASEDGKYTFVVTKATECEVGSVEDGINSAIAASPSAKNVYNLKGVLLMQKADKARMESLPAGIYVVEGKKVVVK